MLGTQSGDVRRRASCEVRRLARRDEIVDVDLALDHGRNTPRKKSPAPLRMVHWRQRTLKVPWDSEHKYTVVRLGLASRMEQRRLG